MAAKHFAKLDTNNIVLNVLVVDDSNAATEAKGQNFLRTLYNDPTAVWKLSDANTGGVGKESIYDPVKKIFYEPQPYTSWTLQADRLKGNINSYWEPPIPRPDREDDGKFQQWNEDTQNWDIETAPGSGIFEPEA